SQQPAANEPEERGCLVVLALDQAALNERYADRFGGEGERELAHDHSHSQVSELHREYQAGQQHSRDHRGDFGDRLGDADPAYTCKRCLPQRLGCDLLSRHLSYPRPSRGPLSTGSAWLVEPAGPLSASKAR